MNNRKKKTTTSDIENDEVEALLQAAQEDIFLKMNVHSHMIHASSSQIIHPDLDQRFRALKSNQSTPKPKPKNPSINKPPENHHGDDDDDDLLGRFEALKKSLPSYEKNGNLESLGGGEEEEDEVEKVIRWAKDAARLDPSPPSDTDEDEDDEEESEDDYDSEEDNVKKGKKGNTSKRK